jgi:hypothetical protein
MSSIGAVVNLGGSIAATFWLGPVGPAIGSLPVVLVLYFVILPITVCRYLEVSVRRYIRSALVPAVPVAAVAGAVALALVHLHPAHSGVAAVVGAIIVVSVSWAAFAVVIARTEPDFRAEVWRRIRSRAR